MNSNDLGVGSIPDETDNHTEEFVAEHESDYEASSQESESSLNSEQLENSPRKKPEKPTKPRIVKPLKTQYSEAYRGLYNETVEELSNQPVSVHDIVPTSQIGLTLWDSAEKEVLFHKVASLGKDNIKDIAAAIVTKSEVEVRQYILLLDQGVTEGNTTYALPPIWTADIPAAFEVSKLSEDALEEFADGLSIYQQRSEQKREKKKHGDHWLLTEDIAAEVEEQVTALAEDDDQEDLDKHDAPINTEPDTQGHKEAASQERAFAKDDRDEEVKVPAAGLLDLPTWLRLSQLFMYQSSDSGENWTDFVTKPDETPSMYHTTFQDFQNLTISLTRRLVQASIFQAMTRLRARDKDRPSAKVTSRDVTAVSDMLGLKRDRRRFWGLVPRRHGLTVYERGTKYEKGQSRKGDKLSLEEAEEKLGVGISSRTVQKNTNEDVLDTVEKEDETEEEDLPDPELYLDDQELWSEISSDHDEEIIREALTIPDDEGSNISSDGEDHTYRPTEDEDVDEVVLKKRQKAGQAETILQKAQDAYLEALDREMSRIEEVHLWDTLKVAPPVEVKDEEIEIPRAPVLRRRRPETKDWREDVEFEAHWERELGTIREEGFAQMQVRGESGRKRRRLAYEYLEKEGLVVLSRPETDNIRRSPRQEENQNIHTEDAPEASQTGKTAANFAESLSNGGSQSQQASPSRLSSPGSVVQDQIKQALRTRKSTVDSERSERYSASPAVETSETTQTMGTPSRLQTAAGAAGNTAANSPQSQRSPSIQGRSSWSRSGSFDTPPPRLQGRNKLAIQVAQRMAEQAKEEKEKQKEERRKKKAEKEEARRAAAEERRKTQESEGTGRVTRAKRKSGF